MKIKTRVYAQNVNKQNILGEDENLENPSLLIDWQFDVNFRTNINLTADFDFATVVFDDAMSNREKTMY